MEAIRCSSTFFPLPSFFFNSHPTLPKGQLLSLTRQWQPNISQPSLQAQALDDAISTAVNSDVHGGDISVFIPLSAALLFIYWVTNFSVPNMIMKDFQPEAWKEEETSEMKAEPSENQNANMPSKLQQKKIKNTTKKATLQ